MSLKSIFKISDANAEITRLSTELTAAKTASTEAQAALETSRTEHATALAGVQKQLTESQAALSTANTERDAARTELATAKARITELESKQTTVHQAAAEIAASVGTTTALKADDSQTAKSKEQLWAEYKELKTQEEQRAFWTKNKAAMR